MTIPRPFVLAFLAALLALTNGCSDELKKEIAAAKAQSEALAKEKASLEVELTKRAVEFDGLKERLAESKKREEEQSQKLTAQQGESERLKAELQLAKDRLAALAKDVENAKAKMADFTRKQSAYPRLFERVANLRQAHAGHRFPRIDWRVSRVDNRKPKYLRGIRAG